MPTMSTEVLDVAQWLPTARTQRLLVNRDYGATYNIDNISGRDLPAHHRVSTTETTLDDLAQLKLFTNLPTTFYTTLVSILAEKTSSVFPRMGQDKSPSVQDCLQKLADSPDKRTLAPENWKKLGWENRESYEKWLHTPVLFAFSGSGHYCSSPRVFEFDYRDKNSIDHFRLTAPQAPKKTTNIFSVAGFEYRGYRDRLKIDATIDQELVKQHAKILMEQILYAATETGTTDVVMIPVGMGVFLLEYKKQVLKEEILKGWIDALNQYPATKRLTVHCCLMPGQFEVIVSRLTNPNIFLQNRVDQDAYTVANAIGDKPGRKSMLVNAGDHDWILPLEPGKAPGQCSLNHTLRHSTSDEYFALLTEFARFSIGNLKKLYSDISPFVVSSVRSARHLVARLEPVAPARGPGLEENDPTVIYIEGPVNLDTYLRAYRDEKSRIDKKIVFVFPGNPLHHTPGNTMFTIKSGAGLAIPAKDIGNAGFPVLSMPTTGMDGWVDQKSNKYKKLSDQAIADLYIAIAKGYSLMIPVREHTNTTYFDDPLRSSPEKEPSFWGGIQKGANKALANEYTFHLNNLHIFTCILRLEGEGAALENLRKNSPYFAQVYFAARAPSTPVLVSAPTTSTMFNRRETILPKNKEPIWDWAFVWQCMSSPPALNTYGTVLVVAGLIIAGAVATSAIPVVLGATLAVAGFALGAACFFNAQSNHPEPSAGAVQHLYRN